MRFFCFFHSFLLFVFHRFIKLSYSSFILCVSLSLSLCVNFYSNICFAEGMGKNKKCILWLITILHNGILALRAIISACVYIKRSINFVFPLTWPNYQNIDAINKIGIYDKYVFVDDAPKFQREKEKKKKEMQT